MQRNQILPWVPLLSIAACSVGMIVFSVRGRCALAPWLCDEQSMVLDLQTMALVVLLPLLLCLGWGVRSGAVQFVRTRRALTYLLSMPRSQLPAPLVPLVNELGIQDRLDVVDDAAAESFCYGFLRPRIYRVYAQLAFAVCQRCVWVFTSPQTVRIMDV